MNPLQLVGLVVALLAVGAAVFWVVTAPEPTPGAPEGTSGGHGMSDEEACRHMPEHCSDPRRGVRA